MKTMMRSISLALFASLMLAGGQVVAENNKKNETSIIRKVGYTALGSVLVAAGTVALGSTLFIGLGSRGASETDGIFFHRAIMTALASYGLSLAAFYKAHVEPKKEKKNA